MANELVLKVETAAPINCIIADTAFEKGTLLTMADPLTVSAASADGYCGGVLANEKIASSGSTSAAVYREGIFLGTSSAAVTAGQALAMTGSGNKLKPATAADTGAKVVGIALETTSGDNETFLFELKIGANNNAYA